MRGCLKLSSPPPSPPTSSSIATPPPTRTPTPPLIPPDVPSLATKRRTPPTLTDACLARRCVHFCSEPVDKIFVADEWDRSPAEVTPRLTYQDILELKEIQRSLPHATQPFNDPDLPELDARGVPRTHFLGTVPVGLVPLISPATLTISQPAVAATPLSVVPCSKVEPSPCHPHPSRPPPSPPSTPPPQILVMKPPSQRALNPPEPPSTPTTTEPWIPPPPPPRLPYNIPNQPRPMPRFTFLPLLETPSPPASKPASQRCQSPPLIASLPHSAPQDRPKTPPDRTPSPRDEKIGPSSVSQPCYSAQPAKPCPPIGGNLATTVPGSSPTPATVLDRSSKLATLPFLSSSSEPSNTKDAAQEDLTHLGAELTHLWHSPSYNTDGETEAEESEAESSVVHTEADSDYEGTRACVGTLSSGTAKVVRTPVAATAADTDDDEEGEMALVELENGVMAFVRTPRRR